MTLTELADRTRAALLEAGVADPWVTVLEETSDVWVAVTAGVTPELVWTAYFVATRDEPTRLACWPCWEAWTYSGAEKAGCTHDPRVEPRPAMGGC